jgi:DHA1 family tetracycline resistance protein-like MFS transporter
MSLKNKKSTFLSIYLTFFIDNLSWAVVFPIFAPYFLDVKNVLFSPDTDQGTRMMLLGFFLTAFSLGQFLGAPIIGEYADKHGRKKALAISVFFTLLGLSLSAYSMQIHNLYGLFVGRLITGVFASSTAVCLSCISDLSDSDVSKAKNFGYLSVLAGCAFVVGAFLGGKLSDPSINSSFAANIPLWIASFLTLVNFIFILFGFKETSMVDPNLKFHFLESFQNIKIALKTEKIKRVYAIYFLFLFSWTILFQFIPVLTVERFGYTNSNIADLALFMGVCWVMGSGYLNKSLVQKFKPTHILEICLIGFTILCAAVIFPTHIYGVIPLIGACVILGGLAWPICTSLISNMAAEKTQGKILGLSQSVQSFAMTLAPAIGGVAFQSSLQLPFLLASGTSLLAGLIYYFVLKPR